MAPEDVRRHAKRVSRYASVVATAAQAVVLWIDFRKGKADDE
jgi:hypothetical protein